jgi:kinesin family protein 2/24
MEHVAVDFELGEDAPRNVVARLGQEARWAGTNIDARQAFSVREATQLYRPALLDAQCNFYVVRVLAEAQQQRAAASSPMSRMTLDLVALIADLAMPGQGQLVEPVIARECTRRDALAVRRAADAEAAFRVFVRVRPLLAYERKGGEYEAIDSTSSARALVCHDGRLARSGRRLTMTHRFYGVDAVFPPASTQAEVFDGTLRPLLARVLVGRGDVTVLCYGQTGAGKTHTLAQLVDELARALAAAGAAGAAGAAAEPLVAITFFEVAGREIAGRGAHDLFNGRAPLKLCSDAHGVTQVLGATVRHARDGAELLATVADGLALRSTEATERNPISSRSHAVCALAFGRSGRCLRLVDLAGSERQWDTQGMSAAEHRVSAEINRSLFALKQCFRASALARAADAKGAQLARVPFRAAALTRVLRDCFTEGSHRTAIIAAVSPGSADVLHSCNTLDHVCLMAPHLELPRPAAAPRERAAAAASARGDPRGREAAGALAAMAAPAAFPVTLDVPMRQRRRADAFGDELERTYEQVAVHLWTAEHVCEWLANAHGGRFAQVVVPHGTDGRKLLQLSARRLTELVEDGGRIGRGSLPAAAPPSSLPDGAQPAAPPPPGPGEVSWYVSSQAKVGRALFAALRDEQRGRFCGSAEGAIDETD